MWFKIRHFNNFIFNATKIKKWAAIGWYYILQLSSFISCSSLAPGIWVCNRDKHSLGSPEGISRSGDSSSIQRAHGGQCSRLRSDGRTVATRLWFLRGKATGVWQVNEILFSMEWFNRIVENIQLWKLTFCKFCFWFGFSIETFFFSFFFFLLFFLFEFWFLLS